MRKWRCLYCNHVYDEALGDPANKIPVGTPYEELPDDWFCPDCFASKDDYELISE
jgi:rubredoxin